MKVVIILYGRVVYFIWKKKRDYRVLFLYSYQYTGLVANLSFIATMSPSSLTYSRHSWINSTCAIRLSSVFRTFLSLPVFLLPMTCLMNGLSVALVNLLLFQSILICLCGFPTTLFETYGRWMSTLERTMRTLKFGSLIQTKKLLFIKPLKNEPIYSFFLYCKLLIF